MKKPGLILLLAFSICTTMYGQGKPILLPYIVQDGDTIGVYTTGEVNVNWYVDDEGRRRQKYFARLRRDISVVMPYAKICSMKMEDINRTMDGIKSKKDKDRYLKAEEKKLKEQFEAKLNNLDVDQGKLLIKLIDRETGRSSYSLIKEYKSGFSAFVWNGLAKIGGMSLKDKYDPVDKDATVELIVRSLGYN